MVDFDPERVAQMCADCEIQDHRYDRGVISLWVARLWCNEIGDHVVGRGDTAWAAVQAAHALRDAHK